MLKNFVEHTRCVALDLFDTDQALPRNVGGRASNGSAEREAGARMASPQFAMQRVAALLEGGKAQNDMFTRLACIDEAVDMLRMERYLDNSVAHASQPGAKAAIRKAYYAMRPLFPVAFRRYLQRLALRGWDAIPFPRWPVDATTEMLFEAVWQTLLSDKAISALPFIWFWPDGHESACIMTHDVETAAGRDFCRRMMQMEARAGLQSAFEVVPELRYVVPDAFLQDIRDGGCEVCIHGLNHDGRLFSSEAVFLERARQINRYARAWNARGFRSPVMYRNLDWLPALEFSYDMSVPNVAHLDPQRGGCCTVMPYFIGDLLELPLTMTQDYTLFNILQQRSLDLWKKQIAAIRRRHGLISFIVHPDYIQEPWSTALYEALLDHLAELREEAVWMALPREVDEWWRARREMRLARAGDRWIIEGRGADRARVAFARLEEGRVVYEVEGARRASA